MFGLLAVGGSGCGGSGGGGDGGGLGAVPHFDSACCLVHSGFWAKLLVVRIH